MPRLRLADLLAWTGGRLLSGYSGSQNRELAGISTDTRTIGAGSLFLALRGDKQDGHQYLAQALAAGAGGLLIDEPAAWEPARGLPDRLQEKPELLAAGDTAGIPVILTADTRKALQDIAAGYRLTLPGRVIAISGSVGKTSTRQMISACLQTALSVHQTAGNQNNDIGLPQTLLQAETSHQAIVLEMGMRGPGEIALLSRVARPDIAVLTCIGYSHIGRLGSQEAILAAKAEILEGLQPDGLLLLNADDPLLLGLGRRLSGRRLAYVSMHPGSAALPEAEAEFMIQAGPIRSTAGQTAFDASLRAADGQADNIPVVLPFPGEHHVLSALFGLAAARALGTDLRLAAAGAAACRPLNSAADDARGTRSIRVPRALSVSPESMRAAFCTLANLAGGRRKIAALGGMLELGGFAAAAHREAGSQAARCGFDLLLLTGPQAGDIADGARAIRPDLEVGIYPDNQTLAAALNGKLQTGDCLLIKGSRGFAMEQVTEAVLSDLTVKEGNAR